MKTQDRQGFVYLITNLVNGHVYVGQTRNTIEQRWRGHQGDAKKGVGHPLYNAIRKYGVENFEVTQLCQCAAVHLNVKEIYFVAQYQCFVDDGYGGYNLTRGGMGSEMSQATKHKLALAQFRLGPISDETRRRCRESALARAPLTPENIERRRQGQLKRYEDAKQRVWTGAAARNHFNSDAGDETRRACAEASQRRWATDGACDRASAALKKMWASKSTAERKAVAAKTWAARKAKETETTYVELSNKVRGIWASRSLEERDAISAKRMATYRRNKAEKTLNG